MDKVKGFVFPNSNNAEDDGVAWWMKYAAKAAGILGGIATMFFGVMLGLSPFPWCMVAGIWQVCAGFVMIVIEAPFCCAFIDFVSQFSTLIESRPPWQKTVLYIVISLPPVMLCIGPSSLLGSAMLIGTGVLYGMQVIGKKASRPEMSAAAMGGTEPDEKNIMDDGDWQTNP